MIDELPDLIRTLAHHSNLPPAPDLHTLPKTIHNALNTYTELELRSDETRIDLVTLQNNTFDLGPFEDILTQRGIPPEHIQPFHALTRLASGHTLGFKLPVAGPTQRAEAYVRRLVSVEEADRFFTRRELPCTDTLQNIAHAVQKTHLHMIACETQNPIEASIFFTVYLDERPTQRRSEHTTLSHIAQLCNFTPNATRDLLKTHDVLASYARPSTLYLSFPISAQNPTPERVKLDYTSTPLGLLSDLFEDCGHNPNSVLSWGRTLELNQASYAGVIFNREGLQAARAYFTLRNNPS